MKKPFKITFSGGEPFMRKDILELVRFASNLGIGTHLTTNGTMITPALAKEICSSGLSTIAISIDSLDASVHDYMRGAPGSLKLTLDGVRELSKSEKHPGIVIASIVSGFNHGSLPELLFWTRDIGGFIIQPISDVFLKQGEKDARVWTHSDKVVDTIDKLIQMKKEGYPLLNEFSQLEEMRGYFKCSAK
jgi:MoaA/NifB/PqqE/SkfB family radical SAM enzyme